MKLSTTLTFTFLFAAVAAAYFYLNPADPVVPTRAEAPMRVLALSEIKGPLLLQIQNPDKSETITLRRKDQQWALEHPVRYPAEPMVADGLVTALRLSIKARRLAKEGDWEEYGLLKPSIKVGVEVPGTPRRYLYFGDASPVGDFVYARWEGEREYFLVKRELKKSFQRSVYSLRQKNIFSVPVQRLSSIHARTPGIEYEIRQTESVWRWAEPAGLAGQPVEAGEVAKALGAVYGLYVKNFRDEDVTPPQTYGLSAEAPFLKLVPENGKPQGVTFGRAIDGQDAHYALKDGESVILEIAKSNVDNTLASLEALASAQKPAESAAPPQAAE